MSASFFIHAGNNRLEEINCIKNNFSSEYVLVTEYNFCTLLSDAKKEWCLQFESKTLHFIGLPTNVQFLSKKYLNIESDDSISLLNALYKKIGYVIQNEFKGSFAILEILHDTQNISLFIGNTGLMQAYQYLGNDYLYLFSELKLLRFTSLFERKMLPLTSYEYDYYKKTETNFCFLKDVRRLRPGYAHVYTMDQNTISVHSNQCKPIQSIETDKHYDTVQHSIENLLKENIKTDIFQDIAAVPLSGGIDSALVTSMLVKTGIKVHTYTVGTAYGDEFKEAHITASTLNTHHTELFIHDDDFTEAFAQGVFQNELCDPLYAEGYIGFYAVIKNMEAGIQHIYTGYGADLILGDHVNIDDKKAINKNSEYWCHRAAWTGELSSYLATSFNKIICHPFWEIDLINYCLSIPYNFKYKNDAVKAIMRDMAVKKGYLPKEIAWRKKTPFTKSASLDMLFANYLGVAENNYRIKSYFLYFLFEELFILDKEIQSLDFDFLKYKALNYA